MNFKFIILLFIVIMSLCCFYMNNIHTIGMEKRYYLKENKRNCTNSEIRLENLDTVFTF